MTNATINYDKLAMYTGQAVDGYMGAPAWQGVNSHKGLYGSDLSKAIRAALKDCNIKGVTVSVKSYSGGQSITLTFKKFAGDIISFEDFKKEYYWQGAPNYDLAYAIHNRPFLEINEPGSVISINDFERLPDSENKKQIFDNALSIEYRLKSDYINEYHIDRNECHTAQLKERITAAAKVVNSFNFDFSDSQIDYFHTNFYTTYKFK